MGHVEDRWWKTVRGADGTAGRVRSARHGLGRRWRARYLDPDGRERGRSFDTRAQAEKFLTEIEHSKLAGTYRDPDAGRVTLRKYALEWVASYPRDSNRGVGVRVHLDNHILPALGGMTLAQLAARPSRIQSWLSALKLAPSSASLVLVTLSAVLGAAADDGLIARNPCTLASVRVPRAAGGKVRPPTAAQVAALREALPGRWQVIADCGAGLGLRQGEIFGLADDSVDFLRRTVHIRRQVKRIGGRLWLGPPKGGRDRDVPLPGPVALALAAHMEAYPPVNVTLPWNEPGSRRHGQPVSAGLLFTTAAGSPLIAPTFHGTAWIPARKAAGMASGGLHTLRHYYASVLLAGGVDVRALAEFLGHRDPSVTLRIYAHLMPSAPARAIRAVEGALAQDHGPDTAQQGG